MKGAMRVVFDTNCIISALLFSNANAKALRKTWQQGICTPLVCKESVSELLRVLNYPRFKLSPSEIERLLADFLPWAEVCTLSYPRQEYSLLRDKDDAMFIQLALEQEACYLVSGDKHIFELKEKFQDVTILSYADFLSIEGVLR